MACYPSNSGQRRGYIPGFCHRRDKAGKGVTRRGKDKTGGAYGVLFVLWGFIRSLIALVCSGRVPNNRLPRYLFFTVNGLNPGVMS